MLAGRPYDVASRRAVDVPATDRRARPDGAGAGHTALLTCSWVITDHRLERFGAECPSSLRRGARIRLSEQHILRCAPYMHHQLRGAVKTIEQHRRDTGIAIGPTEAIVRFEGVESLLQQRVRRFDHAKP